MKDLLLTCKQKYPDVAEVLRGKDFKLVFSQQPTKFHFFDRVKLEVVKVPPEYKLLPARWDSRGIFCAVEADGKNDVDYGYKLAGEELPFNIRVLGKGSVIRLCKKIDEMDIRNAPIERILNLNIDFLNIDFLLRNIDGLRVTSYISGFTSATCVVYRGSQNPSNPTLLNRKQALQDRIVKCIQALSEYAKRFRQSQRQAKLPFPGSIKAQRFIHNFQEAAIILYPAIYNQKTEINERIDNTFDDAESEVFIRMPIKDILRLAKPRRK